MYHSLPRIRAHSALLAVLLLGYPAYAQASCTYSYDLNGSDASENNHLTGNNCLDVTTSAGPAILTLNNYANDYTGQTTVHVNTTLRGNFENAFSGNSFFAVNGTLDLLGFNQNVGALSGSGAVVDSLGGGTFSILTKESSTFAGTIDSSVSSVVVTGTKIGNILTLSGDNSGYTNGFTITGGAILGVSSNSNLGSGAVTFDDGAIKISSNLTSNISYNLNSAGAFNTAGHTLDLSSAAITDGGNTLYLTGGGTVVLSEGYSGLVVTDLSTTVQNADNLTVFNGILLAGGNSVSSSITGKDIFVAPGGGSVSGGGTLNGTLSGSDSINFVSGVFGFVDSANDQLTGNEILSSGATFQLLADNAFSTSAKIFAIDGSVDLNSHSSSFGALSGAGIFVVKNTGISSGVLTLSNPGTFSGSMSINSNATVSIGTSDALGSGAVTLNGGVLDLNIENGNFTNNIVLGAGNGTITSVSNAVMELSGGITGSHNITFTSQGDTSTSTWFYLTGTNNYTGATTIHNASVEFDTANKLSSNTINLHNGALIVNGNITVANDIVISGAGRLDGNGTHSANFSGLISGAGDLYINSANTITLSNASNSYVGETIINSTLAVAGDSYLGDSSNGITFNGGTLKATDDMSSARTVTINAGGATIDTNGNTLTFSGLFTGVDALTVQGGGTLALTHVYGDGEYGTPVIAINNATLSITNNNQMGLDQNGTYVDGGTLKTAAAISSARNFGINTGGFTIDTDGFSSTFSGQLNDGNGAGSLTVVGGGALTLSSNDSNYSGGTTISGATLGITDDRQLGSGGSVTLDGGTLRVNEVSSARHFYINTTGGTIDTNGDDSTISGVIGNGDGAGALTKTGVGTLSLTNTNTYTGGTTISGGAISIGEFDSLGSGDVTLAGGTLDIHVGPGIFSNNIVLGAGNGTLKSVGSNIEVNLSGGISGNHNITFASEDSSGIPTRYVLTGTNTYTGTTTINNSLVRFATADKLSSDTIYLNTGGLTAGDGITVANDIVISSLGKFDGSEGNTTTYSGLISGTGDLYIESAGVITLSNTSNSYVGDTHVASATLAISDDANLGDTSGGIIFDAGVLKTNADITSARAITINVDGAAIDVNGQNNTFSGAIGGTGRLEIETSGSVGSVTLSHANTYQGGTTVDNNAILVFSNDNQLGDSSGGITSNSGTFAPSADISSARDFTINTIGLSTNGHHMTLSGAWNGSGTAYMNGGGVVELTHDNSSGFSGSYHFESNTVLAVNNDNNIGASTASLNFHFGVLRTLSGITSARDINTSGQATIDTDGNDSELSGTISGAGDFAKTGLGTLTLSGVLDSTGNVIVNGGTLQAGVDGVFHGTANLNLGNTTDGFGTFDLNGHNAIFKALNEQSGDGVIALGNKNLSFTHSNSSGTYTGTFTGTGTLSFSDSFANISAAPFLTGDSSGFSGDVHVTGGAVGIAKDTSLGTGTITLDGGELMPTDNNVTFTQNIVLASGGGTLGGAYGDGNNFSGTISGAGNLKIDDGTATIILSGNNTYTGNTQILSGALAIGSDSNLGDNSIADDTHEYVLISDGALRATADFSSSRSLLLSNNDNIIDVNHHTLTWNGQIKDFDSGTPATLTVTDTSGLGQGSLVLNHANTYSGGTLITGAAIVETNNAGALGSGLVTLDQGILAFSDNLTFSNDIQANAGFGVLAAEDGVTATVSSLISGVGPLEVTGVGSGKIVLTHANTYQGGTLFYGGTLSISADNNLGQSGTTLTFNDGALLTSQNLVISRDIHLDANGTSATINNGGHSSQFTGLISDINLTSGNGIPLFFTGSGSVFLGNAGNTYTGDTHIQNGNVVVSDNAALGALTNHVVIEQGGTLFAIADMTLTRGIIVGTSGGSISDNGNTITISGLIADGDTTGGLQFFGGGHITLTHANTYTGGTTISDSIVEISADNNLGTGDIGIAFGTLKLSGDVTSAKGITLSGTATIDTTSHDSVFSGLVQGDALVVKGSGTLSLTHANTYAGGTTLSGGALIVSDDNNLGDAATAITFDGGTLRTSADFASARDISITANGGTLDVGNHAVTLTGTIADNVDSGALTVTGDNASDSSLTLSHANTYSGGTTVHNTSVYISAFDNLGTGGITLHNGGLGFNADITSSKDLAIVHTGLVDTNGHDVTLNGTISGGSASINDGFYKFGSGTLTLGGTNTYQGGTYINGGTLAVSDDSNLGDATNGIAFDNGTLLTSADLTITRAIALNNTGGTINVDGKTDEFSGTISGTGALSITGSGTVTLSGPNTYGGGTTISGGTIVQVNADNNLGTGNLTFSGGRLRFETGFSSSKNITLTGTGTLFTDGVDVTLSGDIDGAGTLIKSGNGILTLSGNNSGTGATRISGGILSIGSLDNITSGDILLTGGTLRTTGNISTAQNVGMSFGGGTIDTDGNDDTISGVISDQSGSNSLTVAGAGKLTLSNTNTYSGGTIVNGGYVTAGHATTGSIDALGAGDVTLNDGTGLDASVTGELANNITITGTATIGATTGHTLTLTGGLTYSGSDGTTLHFGTSTDTGTVVLALSSETSTSGGAISIDYGTVKLGATGGQNLLADAGLAITIQSNGTLDLNGYSINLARISDLSGTITNSGGSTVTLLSTTTTTTTENNAIQDGASAIAIDKTGSGNLILTAANSYTGGTHVESGTLTISNDDALGTGTLTMDEGTTLALNGGNHTINNDIVISGDPIFSPAHATTQTFNGVISDGTNPGVLEMQGLGTLVLNGANTYTGGTIIMSGTLSIGTSGSLYSAGAVAVSSGATFDISSSDQTIGDLSGAGHVTVGGHALTLGTSNDSEFSGVISSTIGGGIHKQGSGALTLSGANTYSGVTTIGAGQLIANHSTTGTIDAFGAGDIELMNDGALVSNVTGNFGNIIGIDVDSSPTIAATSGHVLTLTGSISTNTDHSLTFGLNGGTVVLSNGGAVNSGETIYIAGNSTLKVGNSSGSTWLSQADTLVVGSGSTFDLGGNNATLNLAPGTGTITNNGADAKLTFAYNGDQVLAETLQDGTGALALEQAGGGVLTLGSANSYSGGTTFSNGTVGITADNNLGSGDLTFNGGMLSLNSVGNGSGDTVYTNKNFTTTGAGTIETVGTSFLVVNGDLNGSGNLTKTGIGTLDFEGTGGTYTGNTTISAGRLEVTQGSILGTGTITISSGDLVVQDGSVTQDIVSTGSSSDSMYLNAQSNTLSGDLGGDHLLNIFLDAELTAPTVTFTHANTSAGGFSVIGSGISTGNFNGTLIIGAANNLGSGNLDLRDANLKTTADMTISNTLSVSNNGGAINTNGHDVTLNGAVSGTLLAKAGSGALVLANTNTYTDGTIVNGGYVTAGHATTGSIDALGAGDVTLNDGTGLDASVTGELANNITITGTATIGATTGHTLTLTGGLTYSGSDGTTLHFGTSTDTGTVVLALSSETSTSGGAISIDYGTVKLGATGGQNLLADAGLAITIQSNGTLDLNGYSINLARISDLSGTITNSGGSTVTLLSTTTTTTTENNAIQDGASAIAIDKTGSGNLILTAANSYTGGTHVESGTLTISNDDALGTGTLTMDEGTTLALNGGNHTINNDIVISGDPIFSPAHATTQTFNGVISDGTNPGVLEMQGLGTLVLNGANTYTGGTIIMSGTLSIGTSGSLYSAGAVAVSSGATFDISSSDQTIGDLSGAGHVTLGASQLTEGTSNDTTFSGDISGSGGSLVKQGTGTLTLSNANTYTGGTTIDSGTVIVTNDNNLGTGDITFNGTVNDGVVDGVLKTNAAITSAKNIIDNANGEINANGYSNTFSGTISGNGTLEFLQNTGDVVTTVTGPNTFSGQIVQDGGTLAINNNSALGTATYRTIVDAGILRTDAALTLSNAMLFNANTTIDTNNYNSTFSGPLGGTGSLTKAGAGTLTLIGSNNYGGGTIISSGVLQVGNGGTTGSITGNVTDDAQLSFNHSDNLDFGGDISGTGSVTQAGAGTLTLSGSNNYDGTTSVNAGTLQAGSAGAFSNTSAFTLASGSLLDLAGHNETIASIAGTGDVTNSDNATTSTLTTGGNNTSTMLTGQIYGNIALTKVGTGTFTISNEGLGGHGSAYSGATLVSQGTLAAGAIDSLSSNSSFTVSSGATLDIGGTDQDIGSLAGSGTVTNNGSADAMLGTNTNSLITTFAGIIADGAHKIGLGITHGNLTLTNANTYTGGTIIGSGSVLQIGGGGTTGWVTGNITDDGTLEFNHSNSITYSNVISGSGNVYKYGAGTLVLSNHNTYTSFTSINEGTLAITNDNNLGNGGDIAFGDAATLRTDADITSTRNIFLFNGGGTFDANGHTSTFNGNIGNGAGYSSGPLYVMDSSEAHNGTIILNGISTHVGGAVVNSGVLEVGDATHTSASFASGVTVASLGTLRGHGTINGNVISSGTVAPGGSIGTLTINGNYTQNSNGTLSIELDPAETSLLAVSGTASLNGTLSITPDAGTYVKGTHYTIISASGISGNFSGVTNTASGIQRFGISYSSGSVDLIAGATSFLSAASTPNQQSVATILDLTSPSATGDYNTLVNAISGLSPAGQQIAFDQLSGIAGSSLVTMSASDVRAIMSVVTSRLGGGSSAQGSEAPMLEAQNQEIQVADADPNYWGPVPVQPENLVAWVQGFGEFNYVGSSGGNAGLSSTTGGGATGFEARYDVDERLGVMAGAANNSFSINGIAQSGSNKTYALGVYGSEGLFGGSQDGGIVLDASVTGAYNTSNTKRTISSINATARGETNGYSLGVNVGGGYPIHFEEGTTLTPHVGLAYTYSHTNAYTETGASGANLSFTNHDQDMLQSSLGFTVKHKFVMDDGDSGKENSADVFTPEIHLGWLHEILNPSTSVTSSISGVAGSSFTTSGATPDRDAAIIGAGFNYDLNESHFSIYSRYDATLSANQSDHSVTAGVRYNW